MMLSSRIENYKFRVGRFKVEHLEEATRAMKGIEAVGHRVVHGGPRHSKSVRIDSEVVGYLATITDLAPLHLPAALASIAAVGGALPRVPAVACFDTAFHSNMPAAEATCAIPEEWRVRHGIRTIAMRLAPQQLAHLSSHLDVFVHTVKPRGETEGFLRDQ